MSELFLRNNNVASNQVLRSNAGFDVTSAFVFSGHSSAGARVVRKMFTTEYTEAQSNTEKRVDLIRD